MPQLQACHTRMSSDDEEIFKWNMLDDRQFALRPGYKFSNAMTYRQMCQHINMMVQKVGSDAVRPKVRKYANTEKNADLSQNTTETLHIWMVPEVRRRAGAVSAPGHTGSSNVTRRKKMGSRPQCVLSILATLSAL